MSGDRPVSACQGIFGEINHNCSWGGGKMSCGGNLCGNREVSRRLYSGRDRGIRPIQVWGND